MDPRDALEFVRLLALRRRLRWRDGWTRSRLDAHRSAALAAVRRHALARSPFYREFHAGLDDRPLDELPILTKHLAMQNFDSLVTDPQVRRGDALAHLKGAGARRRYLDRYWVSATSGSTGEPGVFIFDPGEWRMVVASFGRGSDWAGMRPGITRRLRIATVTTRSEFHMSSRVGATLPRFWLPTLRLDAAMPVNDLVAALGGWRPEFLMTYPSVAVLLAEEQLDGRLAIEPRIVETGAEVLTREARALIERAWGCRVFDQYAATETAGIAAECDAHRGLHLFEDLLVVENVDADGRTVPDDTLGDRLLVTVLFRHTMPLIRYEISDRVRLGSAPCPCGRPYRLITEIEGRSEETLAVPTSGGTQAKLHPIVFHQLMDGVGVQGWQVVYDESSPSLEVHVVGLDAAGAIADLEESLRRALSGHGVTIPVAVKVVPSIERGATGKAPRIRRVGTPAATT